MSSLTRLKCSFHQWGLFPFIGPWLFVRSHRKGNSLGGSQLGMLPICARPLSSCDMCTCTRAMAINSCRRLSSRLGCITIPNKIYWEIISSDRFPIMLGPTINTHGAICDISTYQSRPANIDSSTHGYFISVLLPFQSE